MIMTRFLKCVLFFVQARQFFATMQLGAYRQTTFIILTVVAVSQRKVFLNKQKKSFHLEVLGD